MFDLFLKEFNLDIMEANDIFESASDVLALEVTELELLQNQGYFEESADDDTLFEASIEKFTEGIKNFFKKIRDAIVKFIKNVKYKIDTMLIQKDVNRRLKTIKKFLAKNRQEMARYEGKKFPFFDYVAYTKAYKKYINQVISSIRTLYHKDYASVTEFEKELNSTNEKLGKLLNSLNLEKYEAYTIEISVNSIVNISEKCAADVQKIAKLYEDEVQKAVDIAEQTASKEDDISKIAKLKQMINHTVSQSAKFVNAVITKMINGIYRVISAFAGLVKKEDK